MNRFPARRRGFALLLVLIVVSFAAVIALMFLLSARQERSGTNAYAQGSEVRQLADQAVNIVIGQINAATHQGTMAAPVSWASQPGMIRTYNTDGSLNTAYKLYSWNNMSEGSSFNPNVASELPGTSWATQPSYYTDLNQAVNGVYPIVDPNVLDTAGTSSSFLNGASNNAARIAWDFPGEAGVVTGTLGYYPNSANVADAAPMPVQWIYVLQDGTWTTPSSVSGNTVTFTGSITPTAANPIVGRVAFWTDDETAKVNVNTAAEGAYWDTPKAGTADELQFAGNPPLQEEFQRLSGHPATTSLSAVFPEILGGPSGFSRWTSMTGNSSPNSVFITALENVLGYTTAGSPPTHGINPRSSFGSISSGGVQAGSQGGTFPITSYLANYAPQMSLYFPNGYLQPSSYAVTPAADRLYATASDAYFQPGISSGSTTTRSPTGAFPTYKITAQMLSQRLFFLTANSVAPETTLYDTPRISLWPITWPYPKSSYWVSGNRSGNISGNTTNPKPPSALSPLPSDLAANFSSTYTDMAYQENLLAFDSTLNANLTGTGTTTVYPYYFQRQDPDSPTYDWTNIPRNQQLVTYLTRELNDANPNSTNVYPTMPGIGASLGAKWDNGDKVGTTDWIALNCFDYIRSMINQYTLNNVSTGASAGDLLYSYTAFYNSSSLSPYKETNAFTVAPLNIANFNGNNYVTEGAYPALRSASLVFYAANRNVPRLNSSFIGNPVTATKLSDVLNPDNWTSLINWTGGAISGTGNTQTTQMRMVMLLNFSQMNPGISSFNTTASVYQPVFWVKVTSTDGTSQFKVNSNSINFPLVPGGNVVQFDPVKTRQNATSASYSACLFQNSSANPTPGKTFSNSSSSGTTTVWSLISDTGTITNSASPFTFTGCPVTVGIYSIDPSGNTSIDPTGSASNLVYSTQLDFSQFSPTGKDNPFGLGPGIFPLPIAPYWNVYQGAMQVTDSKGTHPITQADELANSGGKSDGTTVVGGVLMPLWSTAGSLSTDQNWQQEIVPAIGQMNALGTYAWNATRPTGGSMTLDPIAVTDTSTPSSPEPLIYAYQGGSGATTGTLSPIFDNRVAVLPGTPQGFTGTITGQNVDNPPYSSGTVTLANSQGTGVAAPLFAGTQSDDGLQAYQLVTPYDTVVTLVASPNDKTAGDPRLINRGLVSSSGTITNYVPLDSICGALTAPNNKPVNPFTPLSGTGFQFASGLSTFGAQFQELGSTSPYPQVTGIHAPWLYGGSGTPMAGSGGNTAISNYPSTALGSGSNPSNGLLLGQNGADSGIGVESNALMTINPNWDYTRLPGSFADGGYLLRPDQEYQTVVPANPTSVLGKNGGTEVPFFMDGGMSENVTVGTSTLNVTQGFFSPNREVPSPVILGTLPDSMTTGWQTLNFCPDPAVTMNSGSPHPGAGVAATPSATGRAYSTAPDHLLLDLFWMPVAEPYPISENFATAGKINLNYAMMPFPYLQRKTALDALLKSVWITAQPSPASLANYPSWYKSYGILYQHNLHLTHTRYPVNVNATLQAFDYKFQKGDIFRVASQICDMFLYPNDPNAPNTFATTPDTPPSTANITSWWAANGFTADNERESPYNSIYSRVTTKSNTYTVHWRVQTLHKGTGPASTWTEGSDVVLSELRGSSLIERYIDPNATLPDYATGTVTVAGETLQPMSYYYKWRVASENYFQPSP